MAGSNWSVVSGFVEAETAALESRLDNTRAIKREMMLRLPTSSIRLPIPELPAEVQPSR